MPVQAGNRLTFPQKDASHDLCCYDYLCQCEFNFTVADIIDIVNFSYTFMVSSDSYSFRIAHDIR